MCFLPSEEDHLSDFLCLQICTYSEYQSGHSCFETLATKQMIASCDLFPHDLCSICDPILEKVVKGEKRKTRFFKFQTKTCLNTV